MSGIYIPGLKFPNEDGVLTLRVWGNGMVEALDGYHSFLLSGVKAVPVPEHGRLIDADALPNYDKPIGKMMMFGGEYVYTQTAIDNAPTILPADGEGKR